MNEMRKLMEALDSIEKTPSKVYESTRAQIRKALKFLDEQIAEAEEYEMNDDDAGWDEPYADDSVIAPLLREIKKLVAAGKITTYEDVMAIIMEVYDASMGSSGYYGDTDLADHIGYTLQEILGIEEEESLGESGKKQQRREKFFKEKNCPKCGKELDFGYRAWTNAKLCRGCGYEKRGPSEA